MAPRDGIWQSGPPWQGSHYPRRGASCRSPLCGVFVLAHALARPVTRRAPPVWRDSTVRAARPAAMSSTDFLRASRIRLAASASFSVARPSAWDSAVCAIGSVAASFAALESAVFPSPRRWEGLGPIAHAVEDDDQIETWVIGQGPEPSGPPHSCGQGLTGRLHSRCSRGCIGWRNS